MTPTRRTAPVAIARLLCRAGRRCDRRRIRQRCYLTLRPLPPGKPAAPPVPASAPEAAAHQAQDDEEDDGPERRVDDLRHRPDPEVDVEAGQEPIADQRADHPQYQVAAQAKP